MILAPRVPPRAAWEDHALDCPGSLKWFLGLCNLHELVQVSEHHLQSVSEWVGFHHIEVAFAILVGYAQEELGSIALCVNRADRVGALSQPCHFGTGCLLLRILVQCRIDALRELSTSWLCEWQA